MADTDSLESETPSLILQQASHLSPTLITPSLILLTDRRYQPVICLSGFFVTLTTIFHLF